MSAITFMRLSRLSKDDELNFSAVAVYYSLNSRQLLMKTLFLLTICNTLICLSVSAQDCQTSSDLQDLHGEDLPRGREFMCGTGRMEHQMHLERTMREKKGYYDIKGLDFYNSSGYYKKGDKLYFSAHPDTFTLVPNGDISSIEFVGNFIRDKNSIYCNGKPQNSVNAQLFSFIPNTPYALDDVHVYYNASRGGYGASETIQVLEGADPKTFGTLCDQNSNGNCYNYAKDKHYMYHSGERIEGADPASFRLEEMGYARDSKHVYYGGKRLEGSDGSSFEMVDYVYMRDANNVYVHGQIVPGMNGSKFELLGTSGMGSDGNHICYRANVFANTDPDSFVDLGCGYYKDMNNVYSKGQILEAADAASFEIIAWGFTKDKNAVYCDDEVIPNAKPNSFEVLGRKYSRDEKHIFYLKTALVDCQRDSFIVDPTEPSNGEDSKATYIRGKRTKK
jgi:hypothetical protein